MTTAGTGGPAPTMHRSPTVHRLAHQSTPRAAIFSSRAPARHAVHDPPPVATIAQVAELAEHVREVAGAEHVGIGGDFDGCEAMTDGLADVTGTQW